MDREESLRPRDREPVEESVDAAVSGVAMILTGFLGDADGNGGAKGDTLELNVDSCVGRVSGSKVFEATGADGLQVEYVTGRMRDRLLISSSAGVRQFRFLPSERWGPFGSRIVEDASGRLSGCRPASRSEVRRLLAELKLIT